MRPSVLITGGAGYIGSHTAVALHEAGYRPVIFDNFSRADHRVLDALAQIMGEAPVCYEGDCRDATALNRTMRLESVTGVIHFAAYKAVGESMRDPLAYYHNNVGAMLQLLESMQVCGVHRLIFSSSCTVYGIPDKLPVSETTPIRTPNSVYGATKQICENILFDLARAGSPPQSILLRYFNPIGAHQSGLIGEWPVGEPDNLVPYITQVAAGWRAQLQVFGADYDTPDGSCIRDFIHVMDLAEAHALALDSLFKGKDARPCATYNIGLGQGASVLELIAIFEEVSGRPLPHRIAPRRPGDVPAIYADVSLAERELGWKARRSIRQALEDAWRWQQNLGEKADA